MPYPGAMRGILLCLALLLTACSTLPRNALPVELSGQATVPGMPVVRAYGGVLSPDMMADLVHSFSQESSRDFPVASDGLIHYPHIALSGGGQNGAFGAGLINGWSEQGTRPVFKIVTGVSTGALMAPFVFLGPEYDDELEQFYTTTSSPNIFTQLRILPQLVRGESLLDTLPLQMLIAKLIDEQFIERVALAHGQGRRLYMATADLDSQQFVVWNMGLIAASGKPGALDLFRKVMLASSSIPIFFPPVLFEVEAGGRRYDELHVDGAVSSTVFYSAGVFDFQAALDSRQGKPGREDIYIIHNGQIAALPGITERRLTSIGFRSLDMAARATVTGDLFRIYASAQRSQAGFFWVTIPGEVSLDSEQMFDPATMRRLYDFGYEKGKAGGFWYMSPPGL